MIKWPTALFSRRPDIMGLPGQWVWQSGRINIILRDPLPVPWRIKQMATRQKKSSDRRRYFKTCRRFGVDPVGLLPGTVIVHSPWAERERLNALGRRGEYNHGPYALSRKAKLRYFKRKSWSERMEGIYQAFKSASIASSIRLTRRRSYILTQIMAEIAVDPTGTGRILKEMASHSRDFFLGASGPYSGVFSGWVKDIGRHKAGRFSFLKRALPYDDYPADVFKEVRDRLMTPLRISEMWSHRFRSWMESWIQKNRPRELPASLGLGPSNSASLERGRGFGGAKSVYRDMGAYYLIRSRHTLRQARGGLYRMMKMLALTRPSPVQAPAMRGFPRSLPRRLGSKLTSLADGWFPPVAESRDNLQDWTIRRLTNLMERYGVTGLTLFEDVGTLILPSFRNFRKALTQPALKRPWVTDYRDPLGLENHEDASAQELIAFSSIQYHLLICGAYSLLLDLGYLEHAECLGCDRSDLHLPICPVEVRERGGKIRIPSVTSACVQVLGGLLRDLANLAMRNDPRTKHALTSKPLFYPKNTRGKGQRSQDLSVATDNHAFWFGRVYYHSLLSYFPEFGWLHPVVDILNGPLALVDPADPRDVFVGIIPRFFPKLPDILFVEEKERRTIFLDAMPEVPKEDLFPLLLDAGFSPDAAFWVAYGEGAPTTMGDFIDERAWLLVEFINQIPRTGEVTVRGLMMGFPTAWPILPMVTLCAFEFALEDPWIDLDGYRVPVTWKEASTYGDDGWLLLTLSESMRHTRNIISLGGEPSKTKDVYVPSPTGPSVYLEDLRDNGIPLGASVIAPIGGAPGISQTSWHNAGRSQTFCFERAGTSTAIRFRVMRSSSFHSAWRFASTVWDLPVTYPSMLGGLGIGSVRVRIPRLVKDTVFTYYSHMNSFEFHNPSNGLSMIPSQFSAGLKWARQNLWEKYANSVELFDGTGIPDREFWLVISSPFFSASIFMGEKPVKKSAPFFSDCHHYFYSRIWRKRITVKPASISPENLCSQLRAKHARWQVDPNLLPEGLSGNFGLKLPGGLVEFKIPTKYPSMPAKVYLSAQRGRPGLLER